MAAGRALNTSSVARRVRHQVPLFRPAGQAQRFRHVVERPAEAADLIGEGVIRTRSRLPLRISSADSVRCFSGAVIHRWVSAMNKRTMARTAQDGFPHAPARCCRFAAGRIVGGAHIGLIHVQDRLGRAFDGN